MKTSPKRNQWLARLLIMTLLCVSIVGCSTPAKDSDTPTDPADTSTAKETEEPQTPNQEAEKEPVVVSDPFFADFEKQVIYDKDGITITAMPSDSTTSGNMLVYPGAIFTLMIKNGTDKELYALVHSVETSDGLALPAWGYWGTSNMMPGQEYDMTVSLNGFSSEEKPAICHLYKEYGLGEKIGDFRVNFDLYAEDTGKPLHKIKTDLVKTSMTGTVPDYSKLKTKPALVDQEGMVLYYVDSFITPEKEVPFFGTKNEMVNVLVFIENNTDQLIEPNYHKDTWQEGISYIFNTPSGPEMKPHTKALHLISVDTKELKDAGIDAASVYQFEWAVMEYLPDDSRNYILTTELITIPLPNPLPQKDILIMK